MHIAKMPSPKLRVFALVRDAEGRPKVDDPASLPPEIMSTLSAEDRAHLGLPCTEET